MRAKTNHVAASQAAILAAAVAGAVVSSRASDWSHWPLFTILLLLALATHVLAIRTKSMRISGAHVVFVLAMVLLGPAPAAAIGVASILVDAPRLRPNRLLLLNNLATHATFPLAGGLAMRWLVEQHGLPLAQAPYLLAVFGVFLLTNLLNFFMSVGVLSVLDRKSLWRRFGTMYVPIIPSELATGLLTVGIVAIYHRAGLAAFVLLVAVLFTFQYLLRELLESQRRAETLETRGRQLASLHLGVISALIHTLDLRDRMTARHCAAVARYSREIARELRLPDADQELVHTAGLLHDIGKFVFPDHILKADVPLTDADWQIIRSHPFQGARIVAQVDGYGPVSDIVIAHHERWDGGGYPRGTKGEDIPLLARIISAADTYDVMTARDSYRTPVSSMDAMRELQSVSGAQLDPRVVDAFISVLARSDIGFRHAEDADFDAELMLEERVLRYAEPTEG
ncbi:MAG: HD-GYP domain-containing protein [Actinomycetota bacterium]|nr:HD-GYP domain-containing protein [Actinomycetota bacterium]